MILKLKSFIQVGMFQKKFLTPGVAVNLDDETRYSTSIHVYHLGTPLWRYNTPKYFLGESILLAKSKEYTLCYIRKILGHLNDKIFLQVGVL